MNIEDIRNQITRSQNEINHLNEEMQQLEADRSTMSEEGYNRELTNINNHLEEEQQRLQTNQAIDRNYRNMVENLRLINQALAITPRDEAEKNEIEKEIQTRQAEIQRVRSSLPEGLQEQARNEGRNLSDSQQSNSQSQEPQPQTQEPSKTRKQLLEEEIKQLEGNLNQQEASIQKMSEWLEEARKDKNEENLEVYNNLLGDLSFFLTKKRKDYSENKKKLEQSKKINSAYDNLLENIRKLNKLSEIVPKDSQEKDKLAEEKERLEEEIKKAKGVLPEEYQNEIRDIILKEQEENKKNPVPSPRKTPTKGLLEICYGLLKDKEGNPLHIKGKTGKRAKAANIRVVKSFRDELHSGNWLYNVVHLAPAVVGLIFKGAKKAIAKFNLWRTQQQDVKQEIKDRINELSKEELDVIRREYRANEVIQDMLPTVLNDALMEKIAVEDTREKLGQINQKISANFLTLFGSYTALQEIDAKLADPSLSDAKKQQLHEQRAKLLDGKSDLVHQTRELYIKGNKVISGGSHGFSEDMRAADSKLNLEGKRFSKTPDYDEDAAELLETRAQLERREKDAIANHDDEAALKAFIEHEMIKSEETEISNSIFGKRSTGRIYYSPLVGEMDYRADPFVRDLFSTIALVGAGISAANAVKTHMVETQKVVDSHNAQIANANTHNQDTIDQVHQTGQEIYDKADVFRKGQEAQAQHDVLNYGNAGERYSLDRAAVETGGDWPLGSSTYKNLDDAQHAMTGSLYDQTQARLTDIGTQYANGQLDQAAALQEVNQVAAESQQTLTELVNQYLPYAQQYASTHPQFQLDALTSGLQYISQNPTAITDMNQAMLDTVNMGQSLTGLTVEQVQALQSLPSDVATTLFGAATAAGLAYKTATTIDQRYTKRTGHGNDLTDMVADFVENQQALQEEQTQGKSR